VPKWIKKYPIGYYQVADQVTAGYIQALRLPEHFEILLAPALGAPKETNRIELVGAGGNIKYWRDAQGVHHVPKRWLDEIILD
jgi:hypothetical protein